MLCDVLMKPQKNMKKNYLKILIIFSTFLTIISCEQKKEIKEMKWLTTETKYDGFPLMLRFPDYKNIWDYKEKFPNLFCITHKLEKVKNNGLPESDYNWTLMDFDKDLIHLFDDEKEGKIIVIETYGGERNYWYYVTSEVNYKSKIRSIQKKYLTNKMEPYFKEDKNWEFLKGYPVKLYENK